MKIEKNYIPLFMWYILPGINAICLLVIFPLLILNTKYVLTNLSLVSVIGWILAGLVIGFLMDSMKLYQYTFKYSEDSNDFFYSLSFIINGEKDITIGKKRGREIFNIIGFMLRDENKTFPLFEHSRWVMVDHSSKIALISFFVWFFIGAFSFLTSELDTLYINSYMKVLYCKLFICLLSLLYLFIGFRLNKVSNEIRQEANKLYETYAKLYKEEISKMIN
ncbi:MAG: hypothetical protein HQK92_13920 [Nitrospirae bacterium]|nr:hypothetical protein [Nitrospirota bacterium]